MVLVKSYGRAASLWYHARGIMYRLVFQNDAARKGPLVVERPSLVIGRRADCHIQIAEAGVCDHHATIERQADGYHIRNLDSGAIICVNGDVIRNRRLASGDELEIGPVHIHFEVLYGVSATQHRRLIDPLEVLAVAVVVAVISAQIALLASLFSENRPKKVKLDAARNLQAAQAAAAASSSTAPAPAEAAHSPRPPAVATPPAPEPTVLNRMIRITRVDRSESGEAVSLTIQAKAQVGARELDTSAVGICVQFAALGAGGAGVDWRKPIWVTIPQWENFASKAFTVRFPGAARELTGFVVRTYYGRQLQDIAASPPSLRPLAPNPLAGGAS
jgi:predicted component of type VI protein secretion system